MFVFSIVNMEYVCLIPVFQPLNKMSLFSNLQTKNPWKNMLQISFVCPKHIQLIAWRNDMCLGHRVGLILWAKFWRWEIISSLSLKHSNLRFGWEVIDVITWDFHNLSEIRTLVFETTKLFFSFDISRLTPWII